MAFKISQKAKQATVQGSGSGGYLSLSKLENKSSVQHLQHSHPCRLNSHEIVWGSRDG